MSTTTLERLDIRDAEGAKQFVREYYEFEGLRFDDRVSVAIETLLGDPTLGSFFAICDGDAHAGYAVLTFAFDHEFGGRIGALTDFYLRPPYRRRGIGSEAIRNLVQFASDRGLNSIDLVVLKHNPGAKEFYERHGFAERTDRLSLSLDVRGSG